MAWNISRQLLVILVDLIIPLPIIGLDVCPSCLNIDTVSIRVRIYIETKSKWVGLVLSGPGHPIRPIWG